MTHNIVKDGETEIWLDYREGKARANLHVLIGYEGTCVSVTPDMLAELRDAIQGVLDAMGVEE